MIAVLMLALPVLVVLGLIYIKLSEDRLRKYRDVLGLKKANLVYAADYRKVKSLILPTRRTAFEKDEPIISLYRREDVELFLGANQNDDLRIWLEAKTVLKDVHIVLDSTHNDTVRTNLRQDKLPKKQIKLEGNFSDHFKLYCNPGQQVLALQIVAPDVMAYLLDNLLKADVEIIDSQIALIIRNGAKSLDALKGSIALARQIRELSTAASKVTKM